MKLYVLKAIERRGVVGDKGCYGKRPRKSRKMDRYLCIFGVCVGILKLLSSVPFALSERFRWAKNIEHVGRELAGQRLEIGIPAPPWQGIIRPVVAY
jgi:hypothetical protein